MSKVNVQKVAEVEARTLPVFAEIEELLDRVRERAYALAEARGFGGDRALEDWLDAEREICWPESELAERDYRYVLTMSLPGFEASDIEVMAAPRELIVRATREPRGAATGADEAGRVSAASGEAWRRVEFSADIDVAQVTATFSNGTLTVSAPRKAEPTTTIEVSAAA